MNTEDNDVNDSNDDSMHSLQFYQEYELDHPDFTTWSLEQVTEYCTLHLLDSSSLHELQSLWNRLPSSFHVQLKETIYVLFNAYHDENFSACYQLVQRLPIKYAHLLKVALQKHLLGELTHYSVVKRDTVHDWLNQEMEIAEIVDWKMDANWVWPTRTVGEWERMEEESVMAELTTTMMHLQQKGWEQD